MSFVKVCWWKLRSFYKYFYLSLNPYSLLNLFYNGTYFVHANSVRWLSTYQNQWTHGFCRWENLSLKPMKCLFSAKLQWLNSVQQIYWKQPSCYDTLYYTTFGINIFTNRVWSEFCMYSSNGKFIHHLCAIWEYWTIYLAV